MKFIMQKNVLLENLTIASKFTSSRLSSNSILQGVLLKNENETLHIFSTNLSSFFHTSIKSAQKEKWEIIIDPRKTIEFLSFLEEGNVVLEGDDKKIMIYQEGVRGTFPVMPASDFPYPTNLKDVQEEEMDVKTFMFLTGSVLFSSSKDAGRPVLHSVFFDLREEKKKLVSTDGFRLTCAPFPAKTTGSFLVPSSFLHEATSLMKANDKIIWKYSPSEKVFEIKAGDCTLSTRTVEGDFPPYERVIPQEKSVTVLVDTQELEKKIKAVSVFAKEQSGVIVCEVGDGKISLFPKTAEKDVAIASLDAKVEGNTLRVAYNYRYILDYLSTTKKKNVTIEFMRSDSPSLFLEEGRKGRLHVIMPVRIQD